MTPNINILAQIVIQQITTNNPFMRTLFQICLLVFTSPLVAQTINTRTLAKLPKQLEESSGIYVQSENSIWSHGDSGAPPELYQVDSSGKLLRTLYIKNANNIDWEEITTDTQGNGYIGDFGNNNSDRKDLTIYKIPNFNSVKTDTVSAQLIQFNYEDQINFPPITNNQYFDCEAMLAIGDSIYLFTKDFFAKPPYLGQTRIYALSNKAGKHTAKLVGVFATDPRDKFQGAITAAAISPDGKTAVLMSYTRLWIFSNFTGTYFWETSKIKTANFNSLVQREAIGFANNCTIFTTSEAKTGLVQQLYTFNLCDLLDPNVKSLVTPSDD
jgi:hypothetical protein